VVQAGDDHSHEPRPSAGGDVIASGTHVDDDDEAGDPDEDPAALQWTGAYIAEREDALADMMFDDVLAAARGADVDEDGVRRALRSFGIRKRGDGTHGRRKDKTRRGEAASEPSDEPAPERQSNRAPGGKVRIIAVDLDGDEPAVDELQGVSIVVRIRCDAPGRLNARVLVRTGERAEVEAVAPSRDVTSPGMFALRCDIPDDTLSAFRHAVDVEAWLNTATEEYASMHTQAQRFRSREGGRRRPFARVDATWSEDGF
jgi:hypothetical protein